MKPVNFIDLSAEIGDDTWVWHYAVILSGVVIGRNCSIGSFVEVGKNCSIGDGTRIGSHTFLPPGAKIGRNVFIGPSCTFTDDKHPKVGNTGYHAEPPVIEDNASIGAGCVILPGVHIGSNAVIGAGSVVTRSVPPGGLVYGDKARLRETVNFIHEDLPYGKG